MFVAVARRTRQRYYCEVHASNTPQRDTRVWQARALSVYAFNAIRRCDGVEAARREEFLAGVVNAPSSVVQATISLSRFVRSAYRRSVAVVRMQARIVASPGCGGVCAGCV